ncbi:AAA family ATPase [Arthrobacter sp. LS16]|uniref:AAA family ATPase n=1 Tax=Arthrobacter sp. 'calajunan' TaxID=1690248 RepID=UPI003C7269DA
MDLNVDLILKKARLALRVLYNTGIPHDHASLVNQISSMKVSTETPKDSINNTVMGLSLLEKGNFITSSATTGAKTYAISNWITPLFLDRIEIDKSLFIFDGFDEWLDEARLLNEISSQRHNLTTGIARLEVSNWRQFNKVDVILHPRLTIITGENGSGKTSLLSLLAPHFSWNPILVQRSTDEGSREFLQSIGTISYTNREITPVYCEVSSGVSNAKIRYSSRQQVPGIYINSHRSVSSYQTLNSLPSKFSEWDVLQEEFLNEIQVRYTGNHSRFSPLYRMKEALISAAMYGEGNRAIRPNHAARILWDGYQEILRLLLPKSLQFDRFEIEDAELILVTKTSEFPLEAISGGISAILELSWQIFLRQRDQESFTVCIDEPENHLHPELQRTIIPSFLKAFPNVSFIVATHSPLVVTSTENSLVYALSPDQTGRISSRKVSNVNTSATPDETLTSVLGLDTTLPVWVESKLSDILTKISLTPSASDLRELQSELRRIGLGKQFPAAINSITEKR